jgi:hypothetical protein
MRNLEANLCSGSFWSASAVIDRRYSRHSRASAAMGHRSQTYVAHRPKVYVPKMRPARTAGISNTLHHLIALTL